MNRRLKERLIGTAVIVMVAVIFIPMVLDNSNENNTRIINTNIPPKPESNFKSRIIPLEDTSSEVDVTQVTTPAPKPVEIKTEEVMLDTPKSNSNSIERVSDLAVTKVSDNKPMDDKKIEEKSTDETFSAWVVQLGSFSSLDNAETLVKRLQAETYPAYIEEIPTDSGVLFRVRVGPELSKSGAESTLKDLDKKYSVKGILLPYP